jgi:hypothetical protein
MSVSKLESLPNEILINIFDKYMNGVDILIAFACCQNQRFDALISQCRRLNFNFFNCRKDDFRVCLGLLPAYADRIEELVLSDENTPGQIHAFLTFFPSFIEFKRLRKLYFHCNAEAVDWSAVAGAMNSLSDTVIDTVLFNAKNTNKIGIFNYTISDMFRLRTLKRINLISDFRRNQWESMTNISSNVEYLTISGQSCGFGHLQSIFRCTSHLKYVNVRLTSNLLVSNYIHNNSKDNVILLPTLHTLIMSFQPNDPTKFDMLANYLKSIPALRRLEIKAHRELLSASNWEALLQTSLPLLTHFRLQTTRSCIAEGDFENTLASFETSFWIEKKNFYMMITNHNDPGDNRFAVDKFQINDRDEFDHPVTQWWIVPCRTRLDDTPTNKIISFGLSDVAKSQPQYHYFTNVKNLKIYHINEDLLKWLVTYVNCSQIKYLDMSLLLHEASTISSLLSSMRNIIALRIEYKRLLAYQDVYLGKNNCLKCLDISADVHSFDKKDIITISTLFPNLEHLAINPTVLSNIPELKTYLPYLRSLTYSITDLQSHRFGTYEQRNWDDQLRQQVEFLFQREQDQITVWIDDAALQEPYWQRHISNLSGYNNTFLGREFSYFD